MRELKRRLAVVLIVVMMIGCMNFSGWAATGNEYWQMNTDGEWNYWKNGEILKNQMKGISKDSSGIYTMYYFNEDGAMASDELVQVYDIVDGQDVVRTIYAFPEGKLAKGWVYLDDAGHLTQTSETGNWYYFDSEDCYRLENQVKGIKGNSSGSYIMYSFDEEGRMRSETFVEDGEKYYFEHDGQMAKNKWLNVDGDWYSFNSDGSCKVGAASNSDAEFNDEGVLIAGQPPCPTIDSITLKGNADRAAAIKKETKLTFDVAIASDSEAKEQKLTKNHDFWIEEVVTRTEETLTVDAYDRTVDIDYNKGTYTITYIPYMPLEVEFRAVIDGVVSDSVTVTSEWGANADTEKAVALSSILTTGADDVAAAVGSIKALYGTMEDTSQVKSTWLFQTDALKKLDDSFAMINRNRISTDISDAAALLTSGDLMLIGGSLNAAQGESVSLTAARGDAVTLSETYEKQVSIELSMYAGDTEVSALEVPVVVNMPIPKNMKADGLKVFHIGADDTQELLVTKVEGNKVSFVADSFSNFVFAGNEESDNTGGNGGGGRSGGSSYTRPMIPTTPGQWKQLGTGKWQFIKADGIAYANTWIYVKDRWYFIDAAGIMADGWQDISGSRYYLTPVDGSMLTGWLLDNTHWYYLDETGAMKTGWVTVNGKQYYLGADGIMLANTETPDGSRVDASGAKI